MDNENHCLAKSGRDGAKGSLGRRALEIRASGAVGLRWQAVFGCQIVWNRSTRRAGARGGARVDKPRWVRILMITGGSSMAALRRGSGQATIFNAPPQFGQCSTSMSKTRFKQSRPADARPRALAERKRFDCATWHWAPARRGSESDVNAVEAPEPPDVP